MISKEITMALRRETYLHQQEEDCCCCDTAADEKTNCVICGKPLHYFPNEMMLECFRCHQLKPANVICEDGHFVCDTCHSGRNGTVLDLLRSSNEKDPILLLHQVFRLDSVHMHGPEHHSIVPCVLITAYRNNGGRIDYEKCLQEAWKRGQKMSGGSCGFLGVCGAAAGAGIFASIISGATPLTREQWAVPQRLTARCLDVMTGIGGPRCCKRTSRLAIECAADFCEKEFGVRMPATRTACGWYRQNRECIGTDCPYFPKAEETPQTE